MSTSPKAFSSVLTRLRQSQATNLIRLRYALLSSPTSASATLMENINTIGYGIHHLLGKSNKFSLHKTPFILSWHS